MKQWIFTLAFSLLLLNSEAQRLRLRSDIEVDTIYTALYFDSADARLQQGFEKAFATAHERLKARRPAVVVLPAQNGQEPTIRFTTGATSYSSQNASIWATVANGALIGGHVFMISRFGWTVPLLFFVGPSTFTQLQVQFSPLLVRPTNRKTDFTFSNSAYFAGEQRQKKRNVKAFERNVYRLLVRVSRRS